MALYEGIALIQEKQSVVLDLGTDYTKFGFSGEAAPRCIIRTEFWCPEERRYKRVYDYKDIDELYDNLVHMLHFLYFRHVLVNPKERKVVVVESLLTPTEVRETLARVLYLHYEVPGVVWAESGLCSARVVAAPVAIVVDIGATETRVTPVVYGYPVVKGVQWQPLGGRALHARLRDLMGGDRELSDVQLEDIKVRLCMVVSRERSLRWQRADEAGGADSVDGADGALRCGAGREVVVAARARQLAAEVMFERDADALSLPDIILNALLQCPIDARRPLSENVVVCGGGAELPGLLPRLRDELLHLLDTPEYKSRVCVPGFKFHRLPCAGAAAAWLGAALLEPAAAPLSRDKYRAATHLPDWL